jgi:hypothetical protein
LETGVQTHASLPLEFKLFGCIISFNQCLSGYLIFNIFLKLSLDTRLKIAYLTLLSLSFSYLAFIGYTTSDDVQIAEQSFTETFTNAINAGRLTWVISMPSSLLSETQGSIWYSKILRLLWVGALFHSTYLLLREKLSALPAIFVCLFPIVFFVNDLDHHAFSSYPGLAVYALACFLYSLYFFNLYLKSGSKVALIFSCCIFALSFVTELFPTLIFFLVIYPYLIIKKRAIKSFFHFLIFIVFVIAYYQFKSDAQSYTMNFGTAALKTWYVYSYSQIYDALGGVSSLIKSLNLFFLVKTLILILLIFIIFKNCIKYTINYKLDIGGCARLSLWWLLLSAWINIPVALTLNYQGWVAGGSKAYLYSSLSNFSCSIAIGLLFWMILSRFNRIKWLSTLVLLIMLAIFISNQIKSFANYNQQIYSHNRWILIDKLAKKEYFNNNVCYISPWLFDLNGIIGIRTSEYWDSYLLRKWGINTHILKNTSDRHCENYELLVDPRKKP